MAWEVGLAQKQIQPDLSKAIASWHSV